MITSLLIKNLAKTEEPYKTHEDYEDVDWAAVHRLRFRAPVFVKFPAETNEKWDRGEWVYVTRDGKLSYNEAHIIGMAFVDYDTAALYQRWSEDYSILIWERRYHHTSGMTPEELTKMKRLAQEMSSDGGYSVIRST